MMFSSPIFLIFQDAAAMPRYYDITPFSVYYFSAVSARRAGRLCFRCGGARTRCCWRCRRAAMRGAARARADYSMQILPFSHFSHYYADCCGAAITAFIFEYAADFHFSAAVVASAIDTRRYASFARR
jgi:hypothetical protein